MVYPGAFLVALAEGMINLGIVFFLRERHGAGPALIGWFMGFSVLMYVLGCLLLRPLYERLRPQLSLAIGLAGLPLCLLLLVGLPILPLTFLFSGLYRLCLSFFWPPAMGWLSRGVEGPVLGRRQARFNLSWSTGLVASYVLAGVASERSAGLPLYAGILGFAVLALYFFLLLALVPALRRDPVPLGRAATAGARGAGQGTALRYPAWIGMFAAYVVSGMVAAVFPLFGQDELGASRSLIGALISSRTATQTIGFLLLGLFTFWHYRRGFLLAAQGYLALLLALMVFARSTAFFAVLFPLLGLATAMSYAGGLFHGVAGAPNRTARMAVHEVVLNGGYILGSTVCGLLYQRLSMRAVVLFCLGCSLAALLAQGLSRWTRRPAARRGSGSPSGPAACVRRSAPAAAGRR